MEKEMSVNEAKAYLKENDNKLFNDEITSFVSLKNINKIYDNGFHAVYDFNLDIEKNEFIALVGPSGCGKSTTLRMIAGLEDITSGELYIDSIYSNYLASKDRDIAMVFQSYALYPQMTVYDNIAFGLKMRKLPKEEIKERVFEAADILDLGQLLDRKPKQLSGGQMQRVALGRAIVRQARVFLMDEPLSNLDAKLRVQMRSEIIRIHREVGATTIYVTHDQIEAMTMANRIVVMNKGFIQQIGKPIDVYNNPDNLFVATFIGSPSMNIIDAHFGGNKLEAGQIVIELSEKQKETIKNFYEERINETNKVLENLADLSDEQLLRDESHQIFKREVPQIKEKEKKSLFKFKKKEVAKETQIEEKELRFAGLNEKYEQLFKGEGIIKVGIRPEFFAFKEANNFEHPSNSIKATITMVELLGNEYILHFDLFGDVQAKISGGKPVSIGDEVELVFDLDRIHLFDIQSGLTIK